MCVIGADSVSSSVAVPIVNYTGVNILNLNFLQVQGVNVTPVNKWFWGNTGRGTGLDFKGQTSSGDNVAIANSATANQFYQSTASSVEFWYYARTVGSTFGRLMDKNSSVYLYLTNTEVIFAGYLSTSYAATKSATIPFNTLHHAVGVWDGSYLTVYVDGVAGTPVATTGSPQNDSSGVLYIGNLSARTRTFDGIIYASRIYRNVALSAANVTTLYNAGVKALNPLGNATSQYMFNEGTGSTLTDSVNAVNGTITTAGWTTNWLNKKGLDFRGQTSGGDNVSISNSATANQGYGSTSFSLEVWCMPRSLGSTSGRIFDKLGTKGYSLAFQSPVTSSVIFSSYFSGSLVTALSPNNSYNQLMHYVAVWDGSYMTCYANGVAGTPTACSGTPLDDSALSLYIGNLSSPVRTIDGNLLTARIYRNKALSLSDIYTAYYAGPNAVSPVSGVTSQYLFTEGTGATLTDSVGSVNGTITGALWSNLNWGTIGQEINSLWISGD
jgi:hypothetical protein